MDDIEEKIAKLPEPAGREVYEFIDSLLQKYPNTADKNLWLKISEKSIKNLWDNKEDDIYNELYER